MSYYEPESDESEQEKLNSHKFITIEKQIPNHTQKIHYSIIWKCEICAYKVSTFHYGISSDINIIKPSVYDTFNLIFKIYACDEFLIRNILI